MSDNRDGKSTWWVHVDLTAVIVVIVLLIVGYVVKSEYDRMVNDEIIAVKKAKEERERKEKEAQEANELRVKELKVENDLRMKQAAEKEKERLAERERARSLNVAKEEDRRKKDMEEFKRRQDQIAAERDRQRRQGEEASGLAKLNEQERVREQLEAANREIETLTKKLEPMLTKQIAYKNKINYALKSDAQLRGQLDSLNNANATAASKSRSGGSDYMADDILKTAAKTESVNKEYRDAAGGLMAVQAEQETCEANLTLAKRKRDQAMEKLKQMGVDMSAAPKIPVHRPAATGKQPRSTYILKDQRKLIAVGKPVETDDVITIKTEAGKFETIEKADIEKIVNE